MNGESASTQAPPTGEENIGSIGACACCGYDLRGLDTALACPECGTRRAIARSPSRTISRRALRLFRAYVTAAIAGAVMTGITTVLVVIGAGHGNADAEAIVGALSLCTAIVLIVVFGCGAAWIAARPDRRRPADVGTLAVFAFFLLLVLAALFPAQGH